MLIISMPNKHKYKPFLDIVMLLCMFIEDRVLHKEAWVAKLLGTHLSIQVHKKLKFSWRDNSTLTLKGLIAEFFRTLLQFKNFKLRRVDIYVDI